MAPIYDMIQSVLRGRKETMKTTQCTHRIVRIQDVKVGDTVRFPYLPDRKVSKILRNVTQCAHGRYSRPQIMFLYESDQWGNNWEMDTDDTCIVLDGS